MDMERRLVSHPGRPPQRSPANPRRAAAEKGEADAAPD